MTADILRASVTLWLLVLARVDYTQEHSHAASRASIKGFDMVGLMSR